MENLILNNETLNISEESGLLHIARSRYQNEHKVYSLAMIFIGILFITLEIICSTEDHNHFYLGYFTGPLLIILGIIAFILSKNNVLSHYIYYVHAELILINVLLVCSVVSVWEVTIKLSFKSFMYIFFHLCQYLLCVRHTIMTLSDLNDPSTIIPFRFC